MHKVTETPNLLWVPGFQTVWMTFAGDIISEVVPLAGNNDTLQDTVQYISDWSKENLFQFRPGRCKELTISFKKQPVSFNLIIPNGHFVQSIPTAKILGVTVSKDMKWNDHIEVIIGKASNVKSADLIRFYCSCIGSVFDYAIISQQST